MALFEALYGRKCRPPLCWSDLDEALILDLELIHETTETIRKIQVHIGLPIADRKAMLTKEGGLRSFR